MVNESVFCHFQVLWFLIRAQTHVQQRAPQMQRFCLDSSLGVGLEGRQLQLPFALSPGRRVVLNSHCRVFSFPCSLTCNGRWYFLEILLRWVFIPPRRYK